jgi:signal transduction histidine kinase
MKIYFSLSLKLTIIVVAVSAAVIFSLTFYNIHEQSIAFENIYVDKAKDASTVIDILWSESDSNETIQDAIESIREKNNESIEFIHVFTKNNDTLTLRYSTDFAKYNKEIDQYINYSIATSKMGKIQPSDTESKKITVIAPINISANISGAYEFSFFTDEEYQVIKQRTTNLLLISVISLFVLIFTSLFLLRHAIVKPIIQFRDTANIFGQGNLDTKINIYSRDELGELAKAFNSMAEDLKKSREKLEEYNKILERLIDQKDTFIGQLGHDLKNPLQPLIGLLPILIQQEKNPKMKEHLQVMNENAQYMKELILKTLQLAKLRTEKIEFEYEFISLQDIIHRVIITEKTFLEKNKIKIINHVNKPIQVYVDPLRIEEVFKNLLTNAVKYTPETGGKITISAEEKEKFVQVSIADTGIGMTKEQLSKIFDEFYRADSSTYGQDSVGLGLSITKRIIEKHKGKIWAESKGPNKGSTFYFTLPKEKVGQKNEKDNDS